jgi:hypothetical protein
MIQRDYRGMPHEVIAAAVRRRYPGLTVTNSEKPGEAFGWLLDIRGGTKEQRDAAHAFAERFAEGMRGPHTGGTG